MRVEYLKHLVQAAIFCFSSSFVFLTKNNPGLLQHRPITTPITLKKNVRKCQTSCFQIFSDNFSEGPSLYLPATEMTFQ